MAALSNRALQVLQALLTAPAGDTSSMQEDALLALSALIECMRKDAVRVIPYILEPLLKAIDNIEHSQVSRRAALTPCL